MGDCSLVMAGLVPAISRDTVRVAMAGTGPAMTGYIPYGVDRLPRDPRLRCVQVNDQPLRLNTEPVPADAMPTAIGDHAARVSAARSWLEDQCGEYAPLRRQFIAAYFHFITAEIDAHREELIERLRPYDGLYRPEDFFWSALRPLPRGWVLAGEQYLPADIVFWDGSQPIAIERNADKHRALLAVGITVCRAPEELPFHRFWTEQPLPSSPFRRPLPSPPPTLP
jgi:hypothetical protein